MKGGENMKRISLLLVLCLLLSFGMSIISSAEEYKINPRYNNTSLVDYGFEIQDNVAVIVIRAIGYSNVTSRITVNVKLEKRALLGLIWNDVEEWNETTTNASKNFEFTKSVGSGTYRCSFEITVEGSGGSADIITDQITVKN